MGGDRWRSRLYLDRGDLLLALGDEDAAFVEYRATIKSDVRKEVLDHCWPIYAARGKENDINEVCKEAYPKCKTEEARQLLLEGFYRYTTMPHKVAYEWANPADVVLPPSPPPKLFHMLISR